MDGLPFDPAMVMEFLTALQTGDEATINTMGLRLANELVKAAPSDLLADLRALMSAELHERGVDV